MAVNSVINHTYDLSSPLVITPLRHALATGDQLGDRFDITVTQKGQPVDLTGAGVTGYFIRTADGATVIITGTVSGNIASVTLPESCYAVPGRFTLTVKVSKGDVRHAVYVGEGAVLRSSTDTIIDPGHEIPDLDELLAKIAELEAATAAANAATTKANDAAGAANAAKTNADRATDAANAAKTAADTATTNANAATKAANDAASAANTAKSNADKATTAANNAASAANTAKTAADTAAANANAKADYLAKATFTAHDVEPHGKATVTKTDENGHAHFDFGLVKGDPGGEDFYTPITSATNLDDLKLNENRIDRYAALTSNAANLVTGKPGSNTGGAFTLTVECTYISGANYVTRQTFIYSFNPDIVYRRVYVSSNDKWGEWYVFRDNQARNINRVAFDGTKDISIPRIIGNDLTGQTVDLDSLTLDAPCTTEYYACTTTGGGSNITHKPDGENAAFTLTMQTTRYAKTSSGGQDTYAVQRYLSSETNNEYIRFYRQNNVPQWSAWEKVPTINDTAMRRGCTVGSDDTIASTDTCWQKFASIRLDNANNEGYIVFSVNSGGFYNSVRNIGILYCHVKTATPVTNEPLVQFEWHTAGPEINPSDFLLATTRMDNGGVDFALWCNAPRSWLVYHFDVLSEGKRANSTNVWTLYNTKTVPGSALPTGETVVYSTIAPLKNQGPEVGGRNLYTGSRDFSGSWGLANYWTREAEKYRGLDVISRNEAYSQIFQEVNLEDGKTYTLSFYLKSASSENYNTAWSLTSGEGYIGMDNVRVNPWIGNENGWGPLLPSTGWQRAVLTFTAKGTGKFVFNITPQPSITESQRIYICGMKLEEGEIPTDWSPAPEDMAQKTDLENLKEQLRALGINVT